MERPPPHPLELTVRDLLRPLATASAAARLYALLLETLGPLAHVDTADGQALRWVHRRVAPGSSEVLPWPSAMRSIGRRVGTIIALHLQGSADAPWAPDPAPEAAPERQVRDELWLHDGEQAISVAYDGTGRRVESTVVQQPPGRLADLRGVLAHASDPLLAVARFVAGLDPSFHGGGRLRCPVPLPGGVKGAWWMGLSGARRALFDGRIPASARFVVADGLAGTTVASGATREEALAAYEAEVRREMPVLREEWQTITDDYDDDGNLIARGELPPDAGGAARAAQEVPPSEGFLPEEAEPRLATFGTGRMTLRGPTADVPPISHTPETLPCALIPLDPSPLRPPPFGRWVRLLGKLGATRHAVRAKDGDGFLLVGAEVLPQLDLARLRHDLDELDALQAADPRTKHPELAAHDRFVRFRAGEYTWSEGSAERAEGLRLTGGSRGPRFDAASLDGDQLVSRVRRQRRVRRPSD